MKNTRKTPLLPNLSGKLKTNEGIKEFPAITHARFNKFLDVIPQSNSYIEDVLNATKPYEVVLGDHTAGNGSFSTAASEFTDFNVYGATVYADVEVSKDINSRLISLQRGFKLPLVPNASGLPLQRKFLVRQSSSDLDPSRLAPIPPGGNTLGGNSITYMIKMRANPLNSQSLFMIADASSQATFSVGFSSTTVLEVRHRSNGGSDAIQTFDFTPGSSSPHNKWILLAVEAYVDESYGVSLGQGTVWDLQTGERLRWSGTTNSGTSNPGFILTDPNAYIGYGEPSGGVNVNFQLSDFLAGVEIAEVVAYSRGLTQNETEKIARSHLSESHFKSGLNNRAPRKVQQLLDARSTYPRSTILGVPAKAQAAFNDTDTEVFGHSPNGVLGEAYSNPYITMGRDPYTPFDNYPWVDCGPTATTKQTRTWISTAGSKSVDVISISPANTGGGSRVVIGTRRGDLPKGSYVLKFKLANYDNSVMESNDRIQIEYSATTGDWAETSKFTELQRIYLDKIPELDSPTTPTSYYEHTVDFSISDEDASTGAWIIFRRMWGTPSEITLLWDVQIFRKQSAGLVMFPEMLPASEFSGSFTGFGGAGNTKPFYRDIHNTPYEKRLVASGAIRPSLGHLETRLLNKATRNSPISLSKDTAILGGPIAPFNDSTSLSRLVSQKAVDPSVNPDFSSRLGDHVAIVIELDPSESTTIGVERTAAGATTGRITSMAYYNFSTKKWETSGKNNDFIVPGAITITTSSHAAGKSAYGDIGKEVLENSFALFHSASVGFAGTSGFTINPNLGQNANISLGNRGLPTANYGFPVHKKYEPKSGQIIDMSKYIDAPFVLERVSFEFGAAIEESGPHSLGYKLPILEGAKTSRRWMYPGINYKGANHRGSSVDTDTAPKTQDFSQVRRGEFINGSPVVNLGDYESARFDKGTGIRSGMGSFTSSSAYPVNQLISANRPNSEFGYFQIFGLIGNAQKLDGEVLPTTGSVVGITQANPGVVTMSEKHYLRNGQGITMKDVEGMDSVNDVQYYAAINPAQPTIFSLYADADLVTAVDTTVFPAYTSGGTLKSKTVAGDSPQIAFTNFAVIDTGTDTKSIPGDITGRDFSLMNLTASMFLKTSDGPRSLGGAGQNYRNLRDFATQETRPISVIPVLAGGMNGVVTGSWYSKGFLTPFDSALGLHSNDVDDEKISNKSWFSSSGGTPFWRADTFFLLKHFSKPNTVSGTTVKFQAASYAPFSPMAPWLAEDDISGETSSEVGKCLWWSRPVGTGTPLGQINCSRFGVLSSRDIIKWNTSADPSTDTYKGIMEMEVTSSSDTSRELVTFGQMAHYGYANAPSAIEDNLLTTIKDHSTLQVDIKSSGSMNATFHSQLFDGTGNPKKSALSSQALKIARVDDYNYSTVPSNIEFHRWQGHKAPISIFSDFPDTAQGQWSAPADPSNDMTFFPVNLATIGNTLATQYQSDHGADPLTSRNSVSGPSARYISSGTLNAYTSINPADTGKNNETFLSLDTWAWPLSTYGYSPGVASFGTGAAMKSMTVSWNDANITRSKLRLKPIIPRDKIRITNITNATMAVVTTGSPHNLETGDRIAISGVMGMVSINELYYYVLVMSPTELKLYVDSGMTTPVDSSTYAAYVAQGQIQGPGGWAANGASKAFSPIGSGFSLISSPAYIASENTVNHFRSFVSASAPSSDFANFGNFSKTANKVRASLGLPELSNVPTKSWLDSGLRRDLNVLLSPKQRHHGLNIDFDDNFCGFTILTASTAQRPFESPGRESAALALQANVYKRQYLNYKEDFKIDVPVRSTAPYTAEPGGFWVYTCNNFRTEVGSSGMPTPLGSTGMPSTVGTVSFYELAYNPGSAFTFQQDIITKQGSDGLSAPQDSSRLLMQRMLYAKRYHLRNSIVLSEGGWFNGSTPGSLSASKRFTGGVISTEPQTHAANQAPLPVPGLQFYSVYDTISDQDSATFASISDGQDYGGSNQFYEMVNTTNISGSYAKKPNIDSMYVLDPNDKLILGVQPSLPGWNAGSGLPNNRHSNKYGIWDTSGSYSSGRLKTLDVDDNGNVISNPYMNLEDPYEPCHGLTMLKVPSRVVLFGTFVRDNKPFFKGSDQVLDSDAVHEALHSDNPVIDQFQVNSSDEYAGGTSDQLVSGDMLNTSKKTTAADALLSRQVIARGSDNNLLFSGSFQRFNRLDESNEVFYDTVLHDPWQVGAVNGFIRSEKDDAIFYANFHAINYAASKTTAQVFDLTQGLYPNVRISYIQNADWMNSFPFESKYSKVRRVTSRNPLIFRGGSTQTKVYMAGGPTPGIMADFDPNAGTPVNNATGNTPPAGWAFTGSNMDVLPYAQWERWQNDGRSALFPDSDFGLMMTGIRDMANVLSVPPNESVYPVTNHNAPPNLSWAGSEEYRDKLYRTLTANFIGYGRQNRKTLDVDQTRYYADEMSLYNPAAGDNRFVYGYSARMHPVGFKFGYMNCDHLNPSSVYRSDRYGQFRDMLEQRLYSKTYVKKSDKSSEGESEAAVSCIFVDYPAGTPVGDPTTTSCLNLSTAMTASKPFIDGEEQRSIIINTDFVTIDPFSFDMPRSIF